MGCASASLGDRHQSIQRRPVVQQALAAALVDDTAAVESGETKPSPGPTSTSSSSGSTGKLIGGKR